VLAAAGEVTSYLAGIGIDHECWEPQHPLQHDASAEEVLAAYDPEIRRLKLSAGPVCAIEVAAGDLLRVPRGTWHWFDLCDERRIRAIRLFQDPAGWTPRYTGSGVDAGFEPVCLGPAHVAGSPRA
jgi:1,2-dihydroxy-3-keto-5-methylthiopentene dioxygenase